MRFLLLLFFFLACTVVTTAQTSGRLDRLDSLGSRLYAQGDYPGAIPWLDSAQWLLLQRVGAGYGEERGRLFAVMDRLNLSLQRTNGFEQAYTVFQRSRPVYDALWEAFPADSTVAYHVTHLYLGLSWFALLTDRPEETIRHCRQALRLDPDFLSAYTNLALGYLATRQFRKAKKIYRRFMDTNLALPVSGTVAMRDIFLQDLDYLESLGIRYPDAERARGVLRKGQK